MRVPLSLREFATLARIPAKEVRRYSKLGLLDPDGDGKYDEYDALRLRFVQINVERGEDLEEVASNVREGKAAYTGIELLYPQAHRRFTLEEAAEKVGLEVEQIMALRTALGLPGTLVEEGDVDAFEGVKGILDAGIPWEAVLEAARVFGDALRRLAETEIRLTHDYLHEPMAKSGMSERELAEQSQQVVDTFLPVIDPLLLFLHRQYLVRAAVNDAVFHLESEGKPGSTIQMAVLFVDITSFTTLADVHGDEAAAEILDRLDVLVRSLAIEYSGTLTKQIGDAFMLAFPDPENAVRFAVALDDTAAAEDRFPAMRVGIHAGPVLYRVGDYVGSTVNIASRVAEAAMPNEILVSAPVAGFASRSDIPTEQVGVRMIRGISEPLSLYRVKRERERPGDRDPVCGMVVSDPAGRLLRGGQEYVFCSESCLRRFLDNPGRYMGAAREARES